MYWILYVIIMREESGFIMKVIGIMGAMPEEVDTITAALENADVETYAGVYYHTGHRAGKKLVVCCAGMGKVNAASTTQVLITHFGVNAIIFSGIAGNMCSDVSVGDMVIGKELLYHDAEDSMLVQSSPGTALYTSDPLLVRAAEEACRLTGVNYVVGRIATGDQFVGDAALKKGIQDKCSPHCVEMEGAAVAQVCMRNGVPFVVLRAMSDDSEMDIDTIREKEKRKEFNIAEYVTTASSVVVAAVDVLKDLAPT